MAKKDSPQQFKVRALHEKPEFPVIVEVCPTAAAAEQLYLFGYTVQIVPLAAGASGSFAALDPR
jgi:hypothetical protein